MLLLFCSFICDKPANVWDIMRHYSAVHVCIALKKPNPSYVDGMRSLCIFHCSMLAYTLAPRIQNLVKYEWGGIRTFLRPWKGPLMESKLWCSTEAQRPLPTRQQKSVLEVRIPACRVVDNSISTMLHLGLCDDFNLCVLYLDSAS